MTRIANPLNATALQQSSIVGCVLADLNFDVTASNPAGAMHVSDGLTEVTYRGIVYSPLGQFAGMQPVQEGTDMIARPLKLTLSGVDASLVSLAEVENYQNREVVIYVGFIATTTGLFVTNPEIAWEGRMDYMQIVVDKNLGTITLNCEHRLHREPKIARYTTVDQNNLYPGDTFFNYVSSLVGFKSQWGNQKQEYGGPARASANINPYTYTLNPYGGRFR